MRLETSLSLNLLSNVNISTSYNCHNHVLTPTIALKLSAPTREEPMTGPMNSLKKNRGEMSQ